MTTHNITFSFEQLDIMEFFLEIQIKTLKRYNDDIDSQLDEPSNDDSYRLLLETSMGFHKKIDLLQSILNQVRLELYGDSHGNQ